MFKQRQRHYTKAGVTVTDTGNSLTIVTILNDSNLADSVAIVTILYLNEMCLSIKGTKEPVRPTTRPVIKIYSSTNSTTK